MGLCTSMVTLVKSGWRKYIECQLGKKLTNREWKKLRYKSIYVVATEDKVVLDFMITNINPNGTTLSGYPTST